LGERKAQDRKGEEGRIGILGKGKGICGSLSGDREGPYFNMASMGELKRRRIDEIGNRKFADRRRRYSKQGKGGKKNHL